MVKLLAFCGSIRKQSFNRKLLNATIDAARQAGAEVTDASLADYPMPLYNGDLEAASRIPEAAARFQQLMQAHDGWIIGCPEYNGMPTPLLLNTIDWCSRSATDKGSGDLSAYNDKPLLITSASPGPFAGTRSATHLRTMLGGIGCIVVPYTISVARAQDQFDGDGKVTDESLRASIDKNSSRFVNFVKAHC